jgi:ribosomal protein S6
MTNKEISIEAIPNDPKIYEVGFHIVPTVPEDGVGARVTAIRDVIEGKTGHVISDEYPKYMDLSYPMTKIAANKRSLYKSAYFGWIKFEVDPKEVKEIEAGLKKDDHILRFILVSTVRENTMAPKKALMGKRSEETTTSAPRVEEKQEEKPQLSEEELDKTIDDLVIS